MCARQLGAPAKGALTSYLDWFIKHRIITVIGGGGKTSFMTTLAKNIQKEQKVVCTATTKLALHTKGTKLVFVANVADCKTAINLVQQSEEIITLVHSIDRNHAHKVNGLPAEWINDLAEYFKDIVFIIEGDGSAGKSLKGHCEWDPIIPAATQLVVPVIGIDVWGKPLTAEFVHRPERIKEMLGQDFKQVDAQVIVNLLMHPQGYLRNVLPNTDVLLFINKVEKEGQIAAAEQLIATIMCSQDGRIKNVLIGSIHKEIYSWYDL